MEVTCGSLSISTDFLCHPGSQSLTGHTSDHLKSHLGFRKVFRTKLQYLNRRSYGTKYGISVGRRNLELSLHNDGNEPVWLAPTKGFTRGIKSVLAFLMEQPSQLKYVEWPSFRNTLKTATLSLVLVAMLIVVLTSIDSGLWFFLASVLRKLII